MITVVDPNDQPRLARLSEAHANAFERGWSTVEIETLADRGLLIADDADAFALFSVAVDESELLTVVTPPSLRRSGRGRRLLQAAYPMLRARSATAIFLEVAEPNEAAQRLYLSEGFEVIGRRKKYYGPVDAIVMRRSV